jgi:Ice-binding-like/Secretion system C-terminal sorting domain
MKTITKYPTTALSRWLRFFGAMLTVALMVSAVAVSQTVFPNPASVTLGTAGNYRALAGTDLVVGASCTVHGNVGGNTISNLGTVTGTSDTANSAFTTAVTNLNTAFAQLLSRPVDSTFAPVDLGGMVLGRGVYQANASGTLGLTGTLTLTGVATDIFIIRTGVTATPGTSLITAASSTVIMGGTAVASNVYWVIGTSAELGASSTFEGNILAGTTVLEDASVSFDGRALGKTTVTLNGASVLPVELASFTATANGMNTNLHWSTATEINNSGFEIQRRQTSDWAKVGFVAGAGTSNSPRNYSYTDSKLSAGSYSYRLKQIDNNGAFRYGSTVEVAISSAPAAFALSQNYPNPFNPSTVISYQVPVNSQVTLKVYNMLGQEVATLVNGPQEAGVYTVSFNTSKGTLGLSSGVYVYRLEAGSFVSTKKLVLMK